MLLCGVIHVELLRRFCLAFKGFTTVTIKLFGNLQWMTLEFEKRASKTSSVYVYKLSDVKTLMFYRKNKSKAVAFHAEN
jgi:hypothetical protein